MTCATCGKERPIVDRFGPVGWCQECDEAAKEEAKLWKEEEECLKSLLQHHS